MVGSIFFAIDDIYNSEVSFTNNVPLTFWKVPKENEVEMEDVNLEYFDELDKYKNILNLLPTTSNIYWNFNFQPSAFSALCFMTERSETTKIKSLTYNVKDGGLCIRQMFYLLLKFPSISKVDAIIETPKDFERLLNVCRSKTNILDITARIPKTITSEYTDGIKKNFNETFLTKDLKIIYDA